MTVQTSYATSMVRAVPGLLADIGPHDIVSAKNLSKRAAVLVTVPASPDDSVDYTLSVNGILVAGAADASSTTAEVRTALIDALNANPFITAIATMSTSGADGILITAKQKNFTLTVTSPSNAGTTADLTIADSVVAGVPIPFGVFVKHAGAQNGGLVAANLGASTDVVLGVSVHNHAQTVSPYIPAGPEDTSGGADTSGIPAGDMGSFIRRGRIWVKAEEALLITDTLYARYTATAANGTLGALRNDDDTTKALAIPATCKLLEYDSALGLALMSINL